MRPLSPRLWAFQCRSLRPELDRPRLPQRQGARHRELLSSLLLRLPAAVEASFRQERASADCWPALGPQSREALERWVGRPLLVLAALVSCRPRPLLLEEEPCWEACWARLEASLVRLWRFLERLARFRLRELPRLRPGPRALREPRGLACLLRTADCFLVALVVQVASFRLCLASPSLQRLLPSHRAGAHLAFLRRPSAVRVACLVRAAACLLPCLQLSQWDLLMRRGCHLCRTTVSGA